MEQDNLYETFLLKLQMQKSKVFIFLKHGIKLAGEIAAFDHSGLILEQGDTKQLVLISAIATILQNSP